MPSEPVLPAEAGALEAAERPADVEHRDWLTPTLPVRSRLGHARPHVRRRRSRRCRRGRSAESLAMATASVLVVVGDHGDDRAEDLLLGDRHAVVDVGEEGRLDEVAALVLAAGGRRRATTPGALAPSRRDVALDALALRLADQRTRPSCPGRPGRRPGTRRSSPPVPRRPRRSWLRGASTRVWLMQAWPLLRIVAGASAGITASRSASSRMIAADLPPSSSEQRLICSPQIAPIRLPARVLPVKLILSTQRVPDELLAHRRGRPGRR